MEFRVLGPLEVREAGSVVDIGSPRQRALLAILVSRHGQVVSTDELLDLVWGDDPPEAGVKALRFHVSKLRDALEPNRAKGDGGIIATQAPGYLLRVDGDGIDAVRFERGITEARRLASTDAAGALGTLDAALALWGGTPYADFAYDEFARSEVLRLEELYLAGLEDRFDLLLSLGRHRDVVAQLKGLAEKHPLRERLWGQLMLAEFRDGRQARALDVYQRLAQRLGDDLGLEPSADLRALEERILLEDRSLLQPGPVPTIGQLRGYELLGRIGEGAFGTVWRALQPGMDREVALKVIRADLANRPEFVRRFEAEARLVASLAHPHIVSLYDFWRDPDGAYLVMPVLRGGSLGELLRAGAWDVAAAPQLLHEVGSALAFAHAHGVVHRDVTPDNILIDENGHAYLADFGVAALVGESGPVPTRSPAFVSPEQVAGEPVTAAADVYSLGVVALAAFAGTAPETVEALDDLRSSGDFDAELAELLATTVATAPEQRPESVEAFLDALGRDQRAALPQPATMVRNPYKGLRAFHEADAPDFFGRDGVVAELLAALSRHRLVGVVGPSGSGKSSVVRAGLIPLLRVGGLTGSDRWLIADLFPAGRPFEELAAALLEVAVEEPAGLDEVIRSGEGWREVVEAMLPAGHEVLLVIDQFEELFTLTEDADIQRRFLDVISDLVTDGGSRVRIIVTLRADFYDRPLDHPVFGDLLRRALVSVPAPSEESLEAAVRGPVNRVGVELEPGLETEIVRDVIDQPGGLPLMEYALTELFERRVDSRMTRDAYHRSGGVLGALGRRAEDLYLGLDDAGRDAVRSMFLRLVTVEEATEDARRRIPLEELQHLGIDREVVDRVLRAYAGHRLVTFDRDPQSRAPTVEVAHEALLREWARLKGWIDGRRDDLIHHRRLAAAIAEWEESNRSNGYLLRGGRLAHFEEFAAASDLALTENEHNYLTTSRIEENRTATTRRRRRQAILAGFGAVAIIAIILAIVAFVAQRNAQDSAARAETAAQEAQDQASVAGVKSEIAQIHEERAQSEAAAAQRERDIARARSLASAAVGALDKDVDLAILLALEATAVDPGNGPIKEAVDALHATVSSSRIRMRFDGSRRVALSGDGTILVSKKWETGRVSVWDVRSGDRIRRLPVSGSIVFNTEHPLETALDLTADGSRIATGRSDGAVALWSASTGEELWTTNDTQYVSLSAADGGVEGQFTLGYLYQRTRMLPAAASAAEIESALEALSLIDDVTVSGRGTADEPWVVFFESVESSWTPRLTVDTTFLTAQHAEGLPISTQVLGRGHHDGVIEDWDYQPYHLVDSVLFTPDGSRVASWGRDHMARIWDVASGEEIASVSFGSGLVNRLGMSFNEDGSELAFSYPGLIWTIETGETVVLPYAARGVAWVPGTRSVFVADYGGDAIHRWNVDTRTYEATYDAFFPGTVAVMPQGDRLVSGGDLGEVTIWQITERGLDKQYTIFTGGKSVLDFAISADGITVAAVSEDSGVVLDVSPAGTGETLSLSIGTPATEHVYFDGSNKIVRGTPQVALSVFDRSSSLETEAPQDAFGAPSDLYGFWTRIAAVAVSADNKLIATGVDQAGDRLSRGAVMLWDAVTLEHLSTLVSSEREIGSVWSLDFSSDGRLLAGVVGGDLEVWETDSMEPVQSIVGEGFNFVGVKFSPDGRTVAARTSTGNIAASTTRLYDVESWTFIECCSHLEEGLAPIDFSPDGDRLITAGADGLAHIWDPIADEVVHSLTDAEGGIVEAVFDPRGRFIATGGEAGSLRLWDATSFEEIATIRHPVPSWIYDIKFSPDAKYVSSAGDADRAIRLWALDVHELIQIARERVTREFNLNECVAYELDCAPAD